MSIVGNDELKEQQEPKNTTQIFDMRNGSISVEKLGRKNRRYYAS